MLPLLKFNVFSRDPHSRNDIQVQCLLEISTFGKVAAKCYSGLLPHNILLSMSICNCLFMPAYEHTEHAFPSPSPFPSISPFLKPKRLANTTQKVKILYNHFLSSCPPPFSLPLPNYTSCTLPMPTSFPIIGKRTKRRKPNTRQSRERRKLFLCVTLRRANRRFVRRCIASFLFQRL